MKSFDTKANLIQAIADKAKARYALKQAEEWVDFCLLCSRAEVSMAAWWELTGHIRFDWRNH